MENKQLSNIKVMSNALKQGGEADELLSLVKKTRKEVSDINKKLAEKESALKKQREEEKTKKLAEEKALKEKEQAEKLAQEAKAEQTEKSEKPVENQEKVVEKPVTSPEKQEVAEVLPPKKEEVKASEPAKQEKQEKPIKQEKAQSQATPKQDASLSKPANLKKEFVPSDNQRQDKPQRQNNNNYQNNNYNNNYQQKQDRGQGGQGYQRPNDRFGNNQPYQKNAQGQGQRYGQNQNAQGQRFGQNGQSSRYGQGGSQGQRAGSQGVNQPRMPRPLQPKQEVAFVPKDTKPTFKKKQDGKSYEDKHTINKKSQMKGNVSISDFDEDKSGYRKLRTKKNKQEQQEQRIKIEKAVISKEIIPLKELSEKIGISAVEISKMLFKEGVIKTINDSIDFDTAAYIASNIGVELELKLEKTAEEVLHEGFNDETDAPEDLVPRAPVVTVMGHVDHGKTSLLDYIRSAHVTDGEAGGITQHIGAYSVVTHGNTITFIDTPGHAAFTSMRARGAQVTDVAVIVIAADDGIMPQTVEAINHAKAANVSIIVAANKIDKPHADIDKVRQQLADREILVEEWGGDVILCPVSAKTGQGVDELLDNILLIAEMQELKANPKRKAKGTVLEARLDKGKGPVASILVQNGTLRTGDYIVAGTSTGKVRAMFDDKGRMVKEAGPSVAVSVIGLEEVPNAGDMIFAVEEEKLSKLVAAERKNKEREEMIRRSEKVTLDELFSKIDSGALSSLNIIIKADVQGSVEAVKQALLELSTPEVKVNVIHAGVGAINETDVMLADSSNSLIIGFNVRPDSKAKQIAERTKTDVKLYRVIYDAIEDIKQAMKGMLAPKFEDVYLGKAEVRDVFKITGVGMVAGCYVVDGKVQRNSKLRIYRDDVMICEGNVLQLKRFKDDVKEVQQGFECGISIEGFNDIKVGDYIESYLVEEKKD